MTWYRNAGRGRYHLARSDWVRSGKAVCGANIARPGYVAEGINEVRRTQRDACKTCKRRAS